MGLGVKDMRMGILIPGSALLSSFCMSASRSIRNLKWDWMVPCHFTPECSNEAEQRKEIL